MLPSVIVNGISTVHRAVLNKVEKPTVHMNLLIDGTGLLAVMGTVGVDHTKTVTNHVMEIYSVLGIEAARTVLIQEVSNTWGVLGCDEGSVWGVWLVVCCALPGGSGGLHDVGSREWSEG